MTEDFDIDLDPEFQGRLDLARRIRELKLPRPPEDSPLATELGRFLKFYNEVMEEVP